MVRWAGRVKNEWAWAAWRGMVKQPVWRGATVSVAVGVYVAAAYAGKKMNQWRRQAWQGWALARPRPPLPLPTYHPAYLPTY